MSFVDRAAPPTRMYTLNYFDHIAARRRGRCCGRLPAVQAVNTGVWLNQRRGVRLRAFPKEVCSRYRGQLQVMNCSPTAASILASARTTFINNRNQTIRPNNAHSYLRRQ